MDTLDPRQGGTVEAGRALSAGLMAERHTVEAVSLDNKDNDWDRGWPCEVHKLGPSYTSYFYCPALIPWLNANADRFDAFLVHNVYRYISLGVSRVARRRNTPYYLFTHGMLDPWFKRNHGIKHLKKTLYWNLFGSKIFADAEAVLYTSEEEPGLARLTFSRYNCVERVVGLGITDPCPGLPAISGMFRSQFPQLKNLPYLLFLGRITPKKGVDLLIQAFAEIYRNDAEVHLVIAGHDENGLQARLAGLPAAKALKNRLVWTGPLYGDVKWSAISEAEALSLTSHTENFAINVSEALALSVPVLITNKVNIWREISRGEAGFVESDDLEGAKRLLSRWRSTPCEVKTRMKQNARATFQAHFEIGNTARRLIAILYEASSSRERSHAARSK